MKKKNKGIYILLYIGTLIFSFSGVITKWMADVVKEGKTISIEMFFLLGALGSIYLVYAVIWQYVLSKMELSIAYMIKSITIIWSVIWSFIFFRQILNKVQLISVLMIFIGINVLQKE